MKSEDLFNETRLLFHTLKHWAETLQDGLELTVPMRGVLELLLLLVALCYAVPGFVERQNNPAHRRSSLIGLTDKGRALIQNMRADELDALSRLQVGVSDAAVQEAAQVLVAWREALREDIERRAS